MFYSRGAEQENDPLYNDVHAFGGNKEPFSDDRKFKVCTSDIGFRHWFQKFRNIFRAFII